MFKNLYSETYIIKNDYFFDNKILLIFLRCTKFSVLNTIQRKVNKRVNF